MGFQQFSRGWKRTQWRLWVPHGISGDFRWFQGCYKGFHWAYVGTSGSLRASLGYFQGVSGNLRSVSRDYPREPEKS